MVNFVRGRTEERDKSACLNAIIRMLHVNGKTVRFRFAGILKPPEDNIYDANIAAQ